MAIKELTEEQVRDMSLAEKDRWWLNNVYRGNMPQLTLRSAIAGMMIGGVLSLTNLYISSKTGWSLGVGITSVILAFATFKVLARLGLGKEFTVLENNAMQSIATAAGYMMGPLTVSLTAYMMMTNTVIPMYVTFLWLIMGSILGVLFAFPLKRRFINDEQHPFPEGRAAGVVMDGLHAEGGQEGMLKAKLLAVTGVAAALLKVCQSSAIMEKVKLGFLAIPEFLDDWIYKYVTPRIAGIELRELTIRAETDFVMMAAGGLMGVRTAIALMVGAVINYCVLAPIMIHYGDITPVIRDGVAHYGFRKIVTWALWGGVAIMTTSSLFAFFSKPKVLWTAFSGMFKGRRDEDVLKDIELPTWVFAIGIPIVGGIVVALAHVFFNVEIWVGIVAIPLIFVFTLIGVNSTALTSITPVSALGQLTQLTCSVIAPARVTTNLMTASITAEVSSNAANLLMDIKPGYMLGGKPRHQVIGHVLGILAGGLVGTIVFYAIFLQNGPANIITEKFPMPSAVVWRSVAEVLTGGLGALAPSSQLAILVGAIIGLVLEAIKVATKGRFWLSGVGIGLACIIPFSSCLVMASGAALFWFVGQVSDKDSAVNRIVVKNSDSICAGVIAGGAVMGIITVLIENFVLAK